MPDYLSCGSCQTDFQLSDITNFIKHKVQHCNDYQDSIKGNGPLSWTTSSNFVALLECTHCLRKFNTPWPLLQHIQIDHHINLMRNIVLPSNIEGTYNISTGLRNNETFSNTNERNYGSTKINDKKTSSTQTIRSCINKIVCPYNMPSDCCLKKEIEARIQEGCCQISTETPCCLRVTERENISSCAASDCCLPTSNSASSDKDVCCQDRRISSPSQSSMCTTLKASSSTRSNSPPCCRPSPPCTRSRSAARKSKECFAPIRRFCSRNASPLCCTEGDNNPTELRSNLNKQQGVEECTATKMSASFLMTSKDSQTDFIDTSMFDFDVNMLLEGSLDDTRMDEPDHQEVYLSNHQSSYLTNVSNHEIRTTAANRETFVTSLNSMAPITLASSNFQPLNVSDLDNFEMSADFNIDQKEQQQRQQHQVSMSNLLIPVLSSSTTNSSNSRIIISDDVPNARKANICETSSSRSPSTPARKRYKDYRFSCTDCSKPFKQNVHLRKHIQSQHTKLKPHKCPYCEYTTVEKSHLTVHIRTHTGEKPFRCRLCNYSTAQNCTLKSHYLRRHPGVTLLCQHCQECFITEHEKDKHEKVCRELNQNVGQTFDFHEQSAFTNLLQNSSTTCV